MNPCPCGYLGSLTHYCTCTEKQIISYQNRLSGPIRDRFDLFLNLVPVNLKEQKGEERETSEEVQKRVHKARLLQYEIYGEEICNGRVDYQRIIKNSPGLQDKLHYLNNLSSKGNWSNRAQIKVVRLARTIADLAGSEDVEEQHIWEGVKLHRRKYMEKHSSARTISES
jgi:magnesium chelatase family protein